MKARAVLLFCSPNTRPQCSAVCGEREFCTSNHQPLRVLGRLGGTGLLARMKMKTTFSKFSEQGTTSDTTQAKNSDCSSLLSRVGGCHTLHFPTDQVSAPSRGWEKNFPAAVAQTA